MSFNWCFAAYAVVSTASLAGILAIAIEKGCATCTGVLSLCLAVQLAVVAWTCDKLRIREATR